VLVFLLFIPSAINNNTKSIYTPFGADLTIQVSVKPNIILDKIIQTPIKPIHNFSGLLRFTKEYPQYNVIADHYGTAHNIFFEWLALFGIVGFLALIISVFLLPLKFFLQIIKNNPEKLWIGLIGVWIILSSMIFGLTETWIVRSAPNGVYMFFVLLLMALGINNKNTST
jgi:hypothetical protein